MFRPEAKPGETVYMFENSENNVDFKPSMKVGRVINIKNSNFTYLPIG
jgi:hypothetical protein